MAFEQLEMSGSLFKNDKREKESQPQAKGSALIGGVEYWISAWTKKDKNGNPWQSLSFKKKDNQPDSRIKQNVVPAPYQDIPLQDCPF